jgi:hypothetical protein
MSKHPQLVGGFHPIQWELTEMHSLNHAVLASATAAERHGSARGRAQRPLRPERPPSPPLRGRAAYAAGRFARRLDREMARRAVV